MPIHEKEALAGLQLLVAVAKADGSLTPEERSLLEDSLAGAKLAGGVSSATLLDGSCDIETVAKDVTSQEGRDAAFSACFAMAYADRTCLPGEQLVLDRIGKAWAVPEEKKNLLGRVLQEARDTAWFRSVEPKTDPKAREAAVNGDILKYSVLSAVLGLNPIPIVSIGTDVAVIGLQAKMFSDIGRHWGRETSRDSIRQVIAGVGVGTGVRLAANNLLKFIPGVGSAFAATTNFASTWALGKVADQYWESGGVADMKMLREIFLKARVDGKGAYEAHRAEVESQGKIHAETIRRLGQDYGASRMTLGEYEKQIAELK